MPRSSVCLLSWSLAVLLLGCPRSTGSSISDAGAVDAGNVPCDGACTSDETCDVSSNQCVLALAPKCSAGTSWSPGQQAFEDVSAAWGLTGDFAAGVRISSADLDGDGWDDLAIRKVGNVKDDPAGARAVWLLRNAKDHFEDVTAASGLLQNRSDPSPLGRPAEIVVFADVDNDGDLDAFTGASGTSPETSEVMLNAGDGTFSLASADSAVRVPNDAIAGASFADVNLDGVVDLWLGGTGVQGAGTQDRLYLGDGQGGFVDLTSEAGLTTEPWGDVQALNEGRAHSYSWGTVACDLNGDGLPELLSSSYGRAPNHLWQAEPLTGPLPQYENRSVASGYAYDDRQDWSDNESARCHCKLHPSDPGCAGVPAPQYIQCNTDADAFRWNHAFDREPFRLGGNTGTTVCADVNGDGRLDLLNLEIVHWDVGSSSDPTELLINTGDEAVRFTRPGNQVTGLSRPHELPWDDGDITGAVFDFDNDGRPDIYIGSTDYPGTRGWLYHQKADGTFEPVPLSDGIDHKSSHGIAIADFDRDGDLDVLVGHSQNRCNLGDQCYPEGHARLFENVIGQSGNWLQLQLVGGEGTNRAAIGARVTVKTPERIQTFEVGGGHGHYGLQHDLVVHAGLGSACDAEVTVQWPDKARSSQTFKVPAGYRFRLEQGGRPTVVRD